MPADLTQRPDLVAMQSTIPQPDPRSSTRLQAAAQRADAKPSVEFAGRRFELFSVPDVFDLAEVGEALQAIDDEDALPALGAMNRLLRRHLADYRDFRVKFREIHPEVSEAAIEAMARMGQQIMEAVTARPTEPPAGSSAGPSSTSTTSRDGSPSPAAGPWTAADGSDRPIPG